MLGYCGVLSVEILYLTREFTCHLAFVGENTFKDDGGVFPFGGDSDLTPSQILTDVAGIIVDVALGPEVAGGRSVAVGIHTIGESCGTGCSVDVDTISRFQ